jgi:hypothetical protein
MQSTDMNVADRPPAETQTPALPSPRVRLAKPEILLGLLFLVTLPLVNPWVRGDGVGYYAFARSLLIEHRLNFENDWRQANETFRTGRVDADGRIAADQYTSTGLLNNHFAIGPAILWAPFLIVTHFAVLGADRLGAQVRADGFSQPYRWTAAMATALYGFLAVWLSFRLARKYIPEAWSFAAAIGIWFASPLPVYMYFDPFWSHAHSAFTVALFVWYWDRTRPDRTWSQWLLLGAASGLMMDVYYPTAVLALALPFEWLWAMRTGLRSGAPARARLAGCALFGAAALVVFSPTLIVKRMIYGSYVHTGYDVQWFLQSPAFFKVLFSSDHGLFTWTPLLFLSALGLFLFRKSQPTLADYFLAVFFAYLYVLGCYSSWDGLSSFGSRYFLPLAPIFVIGLAATLHALSLALGRRGRWAWAVVALAVVWNLGLIFQWGTHLIPARGPIDWREATYNQVAVVPMRVTGDLENYLLRRGEMMEKIEREDVESLKEDGAAPPPQREP